MRQGHWAVVDLIGKGGHIRTVPIPQWVKAALHFHRHGSTRSSCRLARLLSGGEFLLSGDDTSSLLRLLLVFWRFLFWWFFLCRFLFSGWSGGFSLGFRSWLIRSRLVWSRGWFRRFRTIRGFRSWLIRSRLVWSRGWFRRFRAIRGFRRFSSMLGRYGSGLGRGLSWSSSGFSRLG